MSLHNEDQERACPECGSPLERRDWAGETVLCCTLCDYASDAAGVPYDYTCEKCGCGITATQADENGGQCAVCVAGGSIIESRERQFLNSGDAGGGSDGHTY